MEEKMIELAFDASTKSASVCVVEGGDVLSSFSIHNGLTHSQELMPLIDSALKFALKDISDVSRILVANGPGSFTGVRIAMSTAKGLAHGLGIPVVTVPTLYALSYHGLYHDGLVCPIMDARRNRVYAACFDGFGGGLIVDPSPLDIDDLIYELTSSLPWMTSNVKVLFVGDGLPKYGSILKEKLGDRAILGVEATTLATAEGLVYSNRVYRFYESKYSKALPIYLRKPQAEREKMALI